MRISLPAPHLFSIDSGTAWSLDEGDPKTREQLGIYLRSLERGAYLNVRAQEAGNHPATQAGLLALLREQQWASPPFDEWMLDAIGLVVVGGSFETVGMGGEIVLEVFVTDGKRIANLAGPAERQVVRDMLESVKQLASTLRFE